MRKHGIYALIVVICAVIVAVVLHLKQDNKILKNDRRDDGAVAEKRPRTKRDKRKPIQSGVLISGVVTGIDKIQSSIKPIDVSKIAVLLETIPPETIQLDSVACNEKGNFLFANVETGKYIVKVTETEEYSALPVFVNVTGDKDINDIVINLINKSDTTKSLEKFGAIVGIVTTPDGTPILGASVYCCSTENISGYGFKDWIFVFLSDDYKSKDLGHILGTSMRVCGRARTNNSGEYRIGDIESGKYAIVVCVNSYFDETKDEIAVEEWTESRADFVLKKGVVAVGSVVDSAGRPIQDASLKAMPYQLLFQLPDHIESAESDSNGSFSLNGLMEYNYEITCSKEGYATSVLYQEIPSPNIKIVLNKGGLVTGKVIREQDNAPIDNFKVYIGKGAVNELTGGAQLSDGEIDESWSFEKKSDGVFEINAKFRDDIEYKMTIISEGFAPWQVDKVKIKAEEITDIGTIRLNDGGTIVVTVVDKESGFPVEGADIVLNYDFEKASEFRLPDFEEIILTNIVKSDKTDGRGELILKGIPIAKYTLIATRDNYAKSKTPIDVVDSVSKNVKIEMSKAGILKGRVLAKSDSMPIEGAKVEVSQRFVGKEDRLDYSKKTTTNAEGYFEITNTKLCDYNIIISHKDYIVRCDMVKIKSGIQEQEYFLEKGGSVRFTVSDASGASVEKYICSIGGHNEEADVTGICVIERIPPGKHEATVTPPRKDWKAEKARNKTVEVIEDKTINVEFIFNTGFKIYGRVTKHEKPAQVGIALKKKDSHDDPTMDNVLSSSTNDNGEYKFLDIETGEYYVGLWEDLQMGSDEYFEKRGTTKSVNLIDKDIEANIILPSGQIKGRVQSISGELIKNATVELIVSPQSYGFYRDPQRTNVDGVFVFEDVGKGGYQICVSNCGKYADSEKELMKSEEDSTETVDFVLNERCEIKGCITTEDGKIPNRAMFVFIDENGKPCPPYSGYTELDNDGNYSYNSTPEGKYKLYVSAKGYMPQKKDIDIREGVTAECDFVLKKGYKLTIRLLSKNGEPSKATVLLSFGKSANDPALSYIRRKSYGYFMKGSEFGEYYKDGLTPGEYSITIQNIYTNDIKIPTIKITDKDEIIEFRLDSAQIEEKKE